MKLEKLGLLFVGALALGIAGCGDDDNDNDNDNGGGGPQLLTLSGLLHSHPLNDVAAQAAEASVTLADLAVAVVNPTDATQVRGSTVIDATACTEQGCPFTVTEVSGEDVAFGLVFVTDNTPGSAANAFVKTGSGAAAKETIDAAQAADGNIPDCNAFVFTQAAAEIVAGVTQNTVEDAVANGFLVGMVVDATNAPVEGATIAGNNPNLTAVYPNADFSDVGTATANHGMFFAVSTAPSTQISFWDVTGPEGGTNTWPAARPAGTTAGSGYAVMMVAN
jgi:hypothetical protein